MSVPTSRGWELTERCPAWIAAKSSRSRMRRFIRFPARSIASTCRRARPSFPGGSGGSELFSKSALEASTTPSGLRRSCDTMARRSSRARTDSCASASSRTLSMAIDARRASSCAKPSSEGP